MAAEQVAPMADTTAMRDMDLGTAGEATAVTTTELIEPTTRAIRGGRVAQAALARGDVR